MPTASANVAETRMTDFGRVIHHQINASRRSCPAIRMAIAATMAITPMTWTTTGRRHAGADDQQGRAEDQADANCQTKPGTPTPVLHKTDGCTF